MLIAKQHKTHQLNGHIGTDSNFFHATRTGHSNTHAKASDAIPELVLTLEEQAIMGGRKGKLLQKAIKTMCDYGRLFDAETLVDLVCAPHRLAFCAVAVLAMSGCSLMDEAKLTQPISNNKIYLGNDVITNVSRHDLDRYTCGAHGILYCKGYGAWYRCQCGARGSGW